MFPLWFTKYFTFPLKFKTCQLQLLILPLVQFLLIVILVIL